MVRYRIAIWVVLSAAHSSRPRVAFKAASADTDMLVTNVGGRVTIGGADELETANEHFELTSQVFRREMVPAFPPFDPHDYGHDDPGLLRTIKYENDRFSRGRLGATGERRCNSPFPVVHGRRPLRQSVLLGRQRRRELSADLDNAAGLRDRT